MCANRSTSTSKELEHTASALNTRWLDQNDPNYYNCRVTLGNTHYWLVDWSVASNIDNKDGSRASGQWTLTESKRRQATCGRKAHSNPIASYQHLSPSRLLWLAVGCTCHLLVCYGWLAVGSTYRLLTCNQHDDSEFRRDIHPSSAAPLTASA